MYARTSADAAPTPPKHQNMNPQLPRTKGIIDLEWDWPSWKFRLPYEALFTTLHDRFNTRTCAIQDPTAFHYDVRDCGETSLCREEFYAKLTERREQRIRELEEVWREISTLLGASPSTWDCPRCGEAKQGEDSRNDGTAERWAAFCQLTRTMSFDSLVRFFDGYVRDEREREAEKSLSIQKMEEKWPIERAMNHDPSCADQTASPPSEAACLPISPKSSHDETAMVRKIGDPDPDADRKQSNLSGLTVTTDIAKCHAPMAVDNKTKRKELLAQLRELPPQNRAEDVSALLEARRRGEKRRPSRICGDLLPYRYATHPEVDLGQEMISVSVFVNLAHYLSKQDVLALARDSSLFKKAKESLKDEELPTSWSDCLREWSNTSPELGLQFYCEIRGVQANPRKRGTDTPVPEPKRQCVILPETRDDGAQDHPPPTAGHISEQPECVPGASEAVSTNVKTPPSASELGMEQTPGTQPVDSTAPKDTSHPQPTNTGDLKNLDNQPARTPDTQKKIMFMTLSRCRVAVYPVQVFPDLIQQTRQDMQFRRREPGGCIYRSDLIRSRAGQFHILVSHEMLGKLGRSYQDCVVVPTSLAVPLTARVAVRQPDGTLVTTEGEEQQVLYITKDGTMGGTGRVAMYLMQPEMQSLRAEIIRFSTHPVCNYVWKVKTDYWKLRVRFTSPWQPFAQLTWFPAPDGSRCTAWANFARAPGEVAVRMGPSGHAVGKATLAASSPFTCSIDIDHIAEDDLIVIFQPGDPTLAPVLSQVFPSPAAEWDMQVAQPMPYHFDETFSPGLQEETTTTILDSPSNRDMASVEDYRIHTTDAARTGTYVDVCVPLRSCAVSAFPSQLDRPACGSRPYCSPYADSFDSASDSTLEIPSDDPRNAQSVTMPEVGIQEDNIDDQCIVVKPLP
ncbi:hypothetical protein CcaCcLH18_01962 [Colletotrichum camelliae]|nr:hypothetical protein CcaCcLH18_01962 [Colletotrichum camelliae]